MRYGAHVPAVSPISKIGHSATTSLCSGTVHGRGPACSRDAPENTICPQHPSGACKTRPAPRAVQPCSMCAEAASVKRRRKTDGSRGTGPSFQDLHLVSGVATADWASARECPLSSAVSLAPERQLPERDGSRGTVYPTPQMASGLVAACAHAPFPQCPSPPVPAPTRRVGVHRNSNPRRVRRGCLFSRRQRCESYSRSADSFPQPC